MIFGNRDLARNFGFWLSFDEGRANEHDTDHGDSGPKDRAPMP